jgi:hypothetical protein
MQYFDHRGRDEGQIKDIRSYFLLYINDAIEELVTQAGWRMPGRARRFKKSIRISSYEGELQMPKKGNVD